MFGVPKKGLCTLILLIVWEVWKERNLRIFEHKEVVISHLLAKIKKKRLACRPWQALSVLESLFRTLYSIPS